MSFTGNLNPNDFDFKTHSSLTPVIVNLDISFVSMEVLVSITRVSVRVLMVCATGLDDRAYFKNFQKCTLYSYGLLVGLLVVAAILALVLCSFSLIGAHYGVGLHI
jgi:hypothetical protein